MIEPLFKMRNDVKLVVDEMCDYWRSNWEDYTLHVKHAVDDGFHRIRFVAGGLVGGTDITYVAWCTRPQVLNEHYRAQTIKTYMTGELARLAATLDELGAVQLPEDDGGDDG